MSTIDAFFVNRILKDIDKDENIISEIIGNVENPMIEQCYPTEVGGELKTAKFEVIKEEEEEYYEHNKTNNSLQNRYFR